MTEYGLIGHPLTHSFSQQYFREKFARLGLSGHQYHLFDIATMEEFGSLLESHPALKGLNVTIPYKQTVIPFLDKLDKSAIKVGAVNVIAIENGLKIGYNSDYYGFKKSLQNWLPKPGEFPALVLGTGGAAKAVIAALDYLGIPYQLVSRTARQSVLSYEDLSAKEELIKSHKLIINTTPLGMHPNISELPDINTSLLSERHFVYDLIYNPEKSSLLRMAEQQGASIKNGLEMLHLQAEKSWEIWNG
jgi:shikimate dehydrogenase